MRPNVTVFLDELGEESSGREVANHVNLHKDLARTAVASTDANGGNGQLVGDEGSDAFRDGLEDHGKGTGLLHGESILKDPHGSFGSLSLHAEAAQGVLTLGGKADVSEDRNASAGNLADGRGYLLAAFKLNTLHATVFDEADGCRQCLLWRNFIASHGEVADLLLVNV